MTPDARRRPAGQRSAVEDHRGETIDHHRTPAGREMPSWALRLRDAETAAAELAEVFGPSWRVGLVVAIVEMADAAERSRLVAAVGAGVDR